MASEQHDRDAALRTVLVEQVTPPQRHPVPRLSPARLQAAFATVVVLIAVIVLSVIALRSGTNHETPAEGGLSTTATPELPPIETLPAGKLLGRFTSDDGPNQDHIIRPNGLAVATQFVCTGSGKYLVFIALATGESGDGACSGGGVGAGGVSIRTTTTVKIRTQPGMRWTLTLIGIPAPKRITLKPIPNPTDSTGARVPYCTSSDLTARYDPQIRPKFLGGELVFTNRSNTTCALAGYPEVRFLDGSTPLGHNTMNQIDPQRTTDHGLEAVIIRPGTSAYSQVSWYLAGENNKFEGTCVRKTVTNVQVDLNYDLAAPTQTGRLTVPIGTTIACLNGAHGALGKYGQISSTVFVGYSEKSQR